MTRALLRRTAVTLFAAAAAVVALAVAGPAQAHGDRGGSSHHGNHSERLTVSIDGGGSVETSDATPSFSGTVTPIDGATSLSATGKVTGKHGPSVTCAASADAGTGGWSCTATSEIKPGWHRLTIWVKASYADGHTSKGSASQSVLITCVEPPKEPTPEPEPSAEPSQEPTAEPEPTPEPSVTAEPEPESEPEPTSKPKPIPEPRSEPPAPEETGDPAPQQPRVRPAAPAPLDWSFRVFNDEGVDITGSPVRMGDRLTIVSAHLPAGARVAIEIHSTPMALGSGSAASDGSLALAITIPAVMDVGEHTLVATLTAPGYAASVASLGVHVDEVLELEGVLDAPPPAEPPSVEPYTGEPSLDADSRGFDDDHTGIADGLQSIFDINAAPWKFAATGSLAAALVLLAALPAELLQSTLSENYGRAFGWLEPTRRRLARLRARREVAINPWLGGAFSVAIAAFILGFAQPGYGFNAQSMMSFAALFLSLFLLNIAVNAVRMGVAWRTLRLPGRLVPMPGALVVGAISVIVSRALHLNPALLFGLVVGVQFARATSTRIAGKLALVAVSAVLALGLGAWLLFSLVVEWTGDAEGVLVELLEETLAATALESLSVLLVTLLPFQFLEGKHLHDWDQRIWAGMYLAAASAFVFIAVPLGDSWDDAREPLGTWLSLLAGFTLIAVSAWALFRFLPAPERARAHDMAHR